MSTQKSAVKFIQILDLPSIIMRADVENLLKEANISFNSIKEIELDENSQNYQIEVTADTSQSSLDTLEGLKLDIAPDKKIRAYFINSYDGTLKFPIPKPGELIKYKIDYDKSFKTEYVCQVGKDEIVYNNFKFLEKQRNLMSYFIKKIGHDIFSGKGIMNISLPIFIFDTRSLLELWVWQNAYCAEYLEKAGEATDPIERIKYATIYSLAKLHLTVGQQKPFNPILGETFQCKIGDSEFYLEQTSHHPPRSHFYVKGKNYVLYGYNEPDANGFGNSINISNKGTTIIEFKDKKKLEVFFPEMVLGGTVLGDRTINFKGILEVVDKANDLFCIVEINPDERGFFEKLSRKKSTFPDHVKGYITSISKNGKLIPKKNMYSIIKTDDHIKSTVSGEFSEELFFDGDSYWKYDANGFPKFYRQDLTLLSDSYFREDMHFLIEDDEELAGKYKHLMEERQRKDRALRKKFSK